MIETVLIAEKEQTYRETDESDVIASARKVIVTMSIPPPTQNQEDRQFALL
jgi:hypothetical protein